MTPCQFPFYGIIIGASHTREWRFNILVKDRKNFRIYRLLVSYFHYSFTYSGRYFMSANLITDNKDGLKQDIAVSIGFRFINNEDLNNTDNLIGKHVIINEL